VVASHACNDLLPGQEDVVNSATQRRRADYDEAPYGSSVRPVPSPDHLAAVAHLFGVDPPAVDTARVLEIGCASGANLLPFASAYPEATVVGIDLSGVQIAAGRHTAAAKGLRNVTLLHGDIAEFDLNPLGPFDFIVCHGVYSWVPDHVREAVLDTIRTALAPQGVAYVSYDVYPGWKTKEVLRDFLTRFDHPGGMPAERARRARTLIDFLGDVAPAGSELERLVLTYLSTSGQIGDNYLLHEELERLISPCYFVDFVERLDAHELVYLADARPDTMYAANYAEETAQRLIEECESQLELEQRLDFVGNRAFRQSLVVPACRAAQIRYDVGPTRFPLLHFASRLPAADGFTRFDHSSQYYGEPGTRQIYTNDHGVKAALDVLTACWPHTVSWHRLTRAVRERLTGAGLEPPADLQTRIDMLLQMLIVRGLVCYRLDPVAPVDDPTAPSMFTR
jgi:SAM-dependent methyltransferase